MDECCYVDWVRFQNREQERDEIVRKIEAEGMVLKQGARWHPLGSQGSWHLNGMAEGYFKAAEYVRSFGRSVDRSRS